MIENLKDQVSFFKNVKDKHPESILMEQVYQLIISDRLRDTTGKYRYFKTMCLEHDAELIKKQSCGFVPSAICKEGRTNKHIVRYTGYAMADFDGIPTAELEHCLQLLSQDPYVVLAYVTISGQGVRVIYRTDVTNIRFHCNAFMQGNNYFSKLLNFPFDSKCKDAARMSFLAYCPHAVFHSGASVMHIENPASERKKAGRPHKIRHADISAAIKAVTCELHKQGKEYVAGKHNEYISSAFYLLNRYGVVDKDALKWASGEFPDYDPSQMESIARSVYQNKDQHGTLSLPACKTDESTYASVKELEDFISTQAEIRYNDVLGRREIRMDDKKTYRDLTDEDENTLWLRAKKAELNSAQGTFLSILNSEYIKHHNPFTIYFSSLPEWDNKTDYIGGLADCVQTTTPELFRKYFRMWLVGMVAGIIDERVVNQSVLTFIGEQGKYKTTWLNHLLPPHLRRYFYTKANSSRLNKDDLFSLAEYALICYEELDDMSNADLSQFKALVTMPYVNERAAYARNRSFRPHIASLCATGNNRYFLKDRSGHRRWLTFEVLNILDPYKNTVDYDHVYSQALALFRQGFRFWVTEEDIRELNNHNAQFEVPNLEMELIHLYYRTPKRGEQGITISNSEILQKISLGIKNKISTVNIGIAMKKMGFKSVRRAGMRGYLVMERTSQELIDRKRDTYQIQ